MKQNTTKQKRLGWGAGVLMSMFSRKSKSQSTDELCKNDFHPNTRKMGLRFTERIRNVFRLQWLRPK